MRQPSIVELLQRRDRVKKKDMDLISNTMNSASPLPPIPLVQCDQVRDFDSTGSRYNIIDIPDDSVSENIAYSPCEGQDGLETEPDLQERKIVKVLNKQFGYPSLKSFQREALNAWSAHQDCLVLAATGSGKSLCFQIPALLTGKVVVVISPLISLMHDQCLKLAKHGVSACFLGSGQPDGSIEMKAMSGMYKIIYVCPETVLRLLQPLQRLAEGHGIALFAIDEVHCVSKWGHDFRPDYRRLSVLRETFSACKLNFLKFDVPIMALTATATHRVRDDILKSLSMSKDTRIVLTSFFRPNLRFSVKHSRTTSPSSYEYDFRELIEAYSHNCGEQKRKRLTVGQGREKSSTCSSSNTSDLSSSDVEDSIDEGNSTMRERSKGKQLSVEFLEDDFDDLQTAVDLDVTCGEFLGLPLSKDSVQHNVTKSFGPSLQPEERLKALQRPLDQGPSIIYTPTRKETVSIAKFLCARGVKAAAYNASLPKSHLRRVHKEFHDNELDVVVATIAFGMGIDKPNVRRIIHYGWPQSLEAYYQEAGRAGRDGKLANCLLYANLAKVPTLLPNRRSEEQLKQAYVMLSDCFKYGMNTSGCRAKILVEYFGEEFTGGGCMICDVCADGPPKLQDLRSETDIFLQVVAACYRQQNSEDVCYYDEFLSRDYDTNRRSIEKPNFRTIVCKIREQSQKFLLVDRLWWRGLARILEEKGYICEARDKPKRVQINFPQPTEKGLRYLESDEKDQEFYVYPDADMVLAGSREMSFSSAAEWGKGWADPEIRKQRLGRSRGGRRMFSKRKSRKRGKRSIEPRTVRGRLAVKLSKFK